jgi:diguanylate cyclase (GGDEF)-like protein/PAS domain S-box-containing protein
MAIITLNRLTRTPIPLISAAGVALFISYAALVGLVFFFFFSREREVTIVKASQDIARSALENVEHEQALLAQDYSWWNDAVTHLTGKVDLTWADDNIGSYLTKRNDITATYVIDASDRTTVAFLDGTVAEADAFASHSSGLGRLVESTRRSPQAAPEPASGFLVMNGKPSIVAVGAITPELGAPPWPTDTPRHVLIFARALDQAFLDELAAGFHLNGLRLLAPGEVPSGTMLPLLGADGTTVATLSWSPDLPGHTEFLAILPLGAGVAFAMGGSFWWFLSRMRKVTHIVADQANIIDQIHDAVIITDRKAMITGWNRGAERMFGYGKREALGHPITLVHSHDIFDAIRSKDAGLVSGADHFDVETEAKKKNGELCPVRVLLSPLKAPDKAVTGVVAFAHDITEQKKLEARLEELSTTDELTGAFNRRHLMLHGPVELQRAKRFKRPLAFLFMDLDHFKRVNDRLGHHFGDLVLSSFSDLCRKTLRPSDLFVRYGGEEFVAMLAETGLDAAVAVAGRIAEQMRQTVFSADPPLKGLTVSIGVSALRGDDDTLEAILERIDKAMYRAKELGRDRVETLV